MHYTLHQLSVFLKVAQLRSITKAAEELNLTQPAVSIQLKNFQDQFEIPLTEIIGRQLHVTPFGIEIMFAAEKILHEVDAINDKALSYKGKLTGKLKLSIVSTGKYIMPFYLNAFLKKNEGVTLLMDVTNKSKVIDSLKQNEIDLALVSLLPEDIKVNEMGLLENELYLVSNATAARKSAKPLGKKEIENMLLLFREEGSGTRKVMETYFKRHHIMVRKKMELTSNEAVKQAVIAGLGNAIMPIIGIKHELLQKELHILPATGFPIKSAWRLIWLKEKQLSPVAEAYIAYIKIHKQEVEEQYFSWIKQIYK